MVINNWHIAHKIFYKIATNVNFFNGKWRYAGKIVQSFLVKELFSKVEEKFKKYHAENKWKKFLEFKKKSEKYY